MQWCHISNSIMNPSSFYRFAGEGKKQSSRQEVVHAALWDYAVKNGITIEGLKAPVTDIDETEEFYETSGE